MDVEEVKKYLAKGHFKEGIKWVTFHPATLSFLTNSYPFQKALRLATTNFLFVSSIAHVTESVFRNELLPEKAPSITILTARADSAS